jgi:hypothetical protein
MARKRRKHPIGKAPMQRVAGPERVQGADPNTGNAAASSAPSARTSGSETLKFFDRRQMRIGVVEMEDRVASLAEALRTISPPSNAPASAEPAA